MCTSSPVAALTAMILILATAAMADTHVIEVADVQPGIMNGINLGAQINGIREVEIRALGVGGRGFYECTPQAQGGWYDFDVRVGMGVGHIQFPTSNQAPFDVTAAAIVDEGSWLVCEGVPTCSLTVTLLPRGLVNAQYCSAAVIESGPVALVVITITADSVVRNEGRSWGSLKAIFRDGVTR